MKETICDRYRHPRILICAEAIGHRTPRRPVNSSPRAAVRFRLSRHQRAGAVESKEGHEMPGPGDRRKKFFCGVAAKSQMHPYDHRPATTGSKRYGKRSTKAPLRGLHSAGCSARSGTRRTTLTVEAAVDYSKPDEGIAASRGRRFLRRLRARIDAPCGR
jgi:hypothetical protein